jgi:hypothetical protein
VDELYDFFDFDTYHLVHLTKLKQSGIVEEFISAFEHLAFRTKGMSNSLSVASKMKFVPMFSWHAPRLGWKLLNEPRKPNRLSPPRPTNPHVLLSRNPPISPPTTPLKIQKLTRAEMFERQLKGLCYNCNEKYFP